MNKKLITLAVAAALAAPGLASAEAVMYGKLNVSLDYADVKDVVREVRSGDTGLPTATNGVPDQPSEDFKGWGFSKGNGYIPGEGRASRLGVKGSEDLGNGLKAVYQIELGINFDTNNNVINNNDTVSFRNTFAGLAGDWGTVLMGRHDTPMKISTSKLDLFADTMADMNGTVGFQDLRADNTVAYISPSWSGFQLALATVPSGGATGFNAGAPSYSTIAVDNDEDGTIDGYRTTAVTPDNRNINSDSISGAYSLAAIYKNGPFFASAAYEALSNEMFMSTAESLAPACSINASCDYIDDDQTQWRIGLGVLDWNGFTLTGIYAEQDNLPNGQQFETSGVNVPADDYFDLPGGPDKVKQWQLQAGYTFGNNMIKAMYGQANYEANYRYGGTRPEWLTNYANDLYDGDRETWAIGFDHNFSKRTTAYILYTQVMDDQSNLPKWEPGTEGASVLPAAGAGRSASMDDSDWDGFSVGLMHSF